MSPEYEERGSKKAKTSKLPLKSALKNSKANITKSKTARANSPTSKSEVVNSEPITKRSKVDKTARSLPKASAKGKEKEIAALPTTFKVVAGTYEKLLYGLEGSFHSEDGDALESPTLRPIFIFPSHVACVKAVAASPNGGKWLATGSTDEIVKVWDLRRRKEIGGLVQHEGSITHLTFPTRSYLVSCSEDGTICIFRARDWVLLRQLRGHKGRVNCVAVHPTGKLALSVGQDRTLRMWDLMRGKASASVKLGKEGEIVRWSTKGDKFIVQSGSSIDVYSTDMSPLHTFDHRSRIQDVRFCQQVSDKSEDETTTELLLVAAEDKKVTIYNSSSEDDTSLPVLAHLVGHGNRVKAIDVLSVALPKSGTNSRSWTRLVATVSSDGWIRIFDLSLLPERSPFAQSGGEKAGKPELECIASYDTKGSRLTCCTLADGDLPVKAAGSVKRKRVDHDNDDDQSSSDEEFKGFAEGGAGDNT